MSPRKVEWKKPEPELAELLALELKGMDCNLRKMFGSPAYFVHGNMFMGVYGDHVFMRLSQEDRDAILDERDDVSPFTPVEGRTMKEYIVLERSFIKDIRLFREWRGRSFAFVSSLPPKSRKRS